MLPYSTLYCHPFLYFLSPSSLLNDFSTCIDHFFSAYSLFRCTLSCCVWCLPLNKTGFSLFLFCPLLIHNIFQGFVLTYCVFVFIYFYAALMPKKTCNWFEFNVKVTWLTSSHHITCAWIISIRTYTETQAASFLLFLACI